LSFVGSTEVTPVPPSSASFFVVSRHGLAVVELEALAQADRVRHLAGRLDRLGEPVVRQLVVAVEGQQGLPPGHQARLIRLGEDVLAVDDVLDAVARHADPQVAALLRARPRRRCEGLRVAADRKARRDPGCAEQRGATGHARVQVFGARISHSGGPHLVDASNMRRRSYAAVASASSHLVTHSPDDQHPFTG
jgi:hypothetical protein